MNFFDLHCDTPYRCYTEKIDPSNNALAVSFDKGKGFDKWYQCFAVWINDNVENPYRFYKSVLADFKQKLKSKPENLTPILTVEGGSLIEDDIDRVSRIANDGIKVLTLTWNGENSIAGGANTDVGLKDFGRRVIYELNHQKMICDLSHLNKRSFYGAIEIADFPCVTHSSIEFVNAHRRNIDDNQLKLLLQKNGIFGLCFYPEFLGQGSAFENIYKNIYHILDLGYEDNLCIGSDFDGAYMSHELSDVSDIESLYSFLKSKKINENILNKIFFDNAYNYFNTIKGKQKL